MSRKLVLVVIFALLASGLNTYSQSAKKKADKPSKTTVTAKDKTKDKTKAKTAKVGGGVSSDVEDLINRSINASGGIEKFNGMKNYTLTGKLSAMGFEIPFTTYKKGKAFRMEQEMMGQKMITVFDGTNGWMINPMMGSADPQPLQQEQLKSIENQANMTNHPLMNLKERGIISTLEGKDTVEGKNAYKIKMFNPEDSTNTFLFLDMISYLPVKIISEINQGGQAMSIETFLKDYKNENGILFAHLYDIRTPQANATMTIEKIDVSSNIDDSLFQMPKK